MKAQLNKKKYQKFKLDRNKKTILLDNQKQLGYEKLIIATGSIVKKLKTNGNAKELHYLRTIKDSIKIREKLRKAKNITIIGAGYIGLEIASVAIKKNLQVRILEMENRVMSRVVSAEVSDFFQNKHQSEGVKFKLNTYITQIEDQGKQKNFLKDIMQVKLLILSDCLPTIRKKKYIILY